MREVPECCKHFSKEKDFTCREGSHCNYSARGEQWGLGTENAFERAQRFRSLGILQVKQSVSVCVLHGTMEHVEILGLPFQIKVSTSSQM